MDEPVQDEIRMKSLLILLITALFVTAFLPNAVYASQKLKEQVRRNILKHNPSDCERVLDLDFSKKQIFILCRTTGRKLLQKVVSRSHLPKAIIINDEDRKSIISIHEAFSKKETINKYIQTSAGRKLPEDSVSTPSLTLMKEDIKDLKSGLRNIWKHDTDTCRRFMANGMDQGEKYFIALCQLKN